MKELDYKITICGLIALSGVDETKQKAPTATSKQYWKTGAHTEARSMISKSHAIFEWNDGQKEWKDKSEDIQPQPKLSAMGSHSQS